MGHALIDVEVRFHSGLPQLTMHPHGITEQQIAGATDEIGGRKATEFTVDRRNQGIPEILTRRIEQGVRGLDYLGRQAFHPAVEVHGKRSVDEVDLAAALAVADPHRGVDSPPPGGLAVDNLEFVVGIEVGEVDELLAIELDRGRRGADGAGCESIELAWRQQKLPTSIDVTMTVRKRGNNDRRQGFAKRFPGQIHDGCIDGRRRVGG